MDQSYNNDILQLTERGWRIKVGDQWPDRCELNSPVRFIT